MGAHSRTGGQVSSRGTQVHVGTHAAEHTCHPTGTRMLNWAYGYPGGGAPTDTPPRCTPGHPHVHTHRLHGTHCGEGRWEARRRRNWLQEASEGHGNGDGDWEGWRPHKGTLAHTSSSPAVAHLRLAAGEGKEAEVQAGRGVEGALGLSSQGRVCPGARQF